MGGLNLCKEQINFATKMRPMVDGFMSQFMHHGKAEHSNEIQGNYTASAMSLPGNDFKAYWGFKKCCSSSFEKAQRDGQC